MLSGLSWKPITLLLLFDYFWKKIEKYFLVWENSNYAYEYDEFDRSDNFIETYIFYIF